ncbi:MAG: hypothetical protein J5833_00575 [Victivallales bacterium]|nr:hypothetical protein [Victivallales bacterium]
MSDKKVIYTDGFGQIHFAGGMIRIDMVNLEPTEEGKPPVPETTARLVVPPQGFLAMFNAMQQMIGKLEEAGLVKRNTNAQQQTADNWGSTQKNGNNWGN